MPMARWSPPASAAGRRWPCGISSKWTEAELDRVSNLDLMAVEPAYRGRGLGGLLLSEMGSRLSGAGVKVWFGGITNTGASVEHAAFFEHHGFKVLDAGRPLPQFLGRRWTVPHTTEPMYWFYRTLSAAGPGPSASAL
jgi:GNAT superfamily N-acetyltransferase